MNLFISLLPITLVLSMDQSRFSSMEQSRASLDVGTENDRPFWFVINAGSTIFQQQCPPLHRDKELLGTDSAAPYLLPEAQTFVPWYRKIEMDNGGVFRTNFVSLQSLLKDADLAPAALTKTLQRFNDLDRALLTNKKFAKEGLDPLREECPYSKIMDDIPKDFPFDLLLEWTDAMVELNIRQRHRWIKRIEDDFATTSVPNGRFDEIQEESEKLQTEIIAIRQKQEKEAENFNSSLQRLENEKKRVQEEATTAKIQIEKQESIIATAQAEIEQLKAEVGKEPERFNQALGSVNTQRDLLSKALADKVFMMEEVSRKASEAQVKFNEMIKRQGELERSEEVLKNQQANLLKLIAILGAGNATMDNAEEILQKYREAIAKQRSEDQLSIQNLKAEGVRLEREIARLQKEASEKDKNNDMAVKKIETLVQQKHLVNLHIIQLESELQGLTEKVRDADKQIQKHQEKIQAVKKKSKERKGLIEEEQQKTDKLRINLQDLESAKKQLQHDLHVAKETEAALRSKLEAKEKELDEMAERCHQDYLKLRPTPVIYLNKDDVLVNYNPDAEPDLKELKENVVKEVVKLQDAVLQKADAEL